MCNVYLHFKYIILKIKTNEKSTHIGNCNGTLTTECKKKDETKTETKIEFLAKYAWTGDRYGVDVNMDLLLTGSEDESKPCDKDNTYSFSANGTLVRNNGTLKVIS